MPTVKVNFFLLFFFCASRCMRLSSESYYAVFWGGKYNARFLFALKILFYSKCGGQMSLANGLLRGQADPTMNVPWTSGWTALFGWNAMLVTSPWRAPSPHWLIRFSLRKTAFLASGWAALETRSIHRPENTTAAPGCTLVLARQKWHVWKLCDFPRLRFFLDYGGTSNLATKPCNGTDGLDVNYIVALVSFADTLCNTFLLWSLSCNWQWSGLGENNSSKTTWTVGSEAGTHPSKKHIILGC